MEYQYIVWIDPRDTTNTKQVMRVSEHEDAFELMDDLREHGITNIHLQNSEPVSVRETE